MNSSNRKRLFADVISIDAWHEPFADGVAEVDLYADVAFGTARIGGEVDSPVRFRLSLRRAEVVVVIPDHEPIRVARDSVARETIQIDAHVTGTIEKTTRRGASVGGGISASSSGISAHATLDGKIEGEVASATKVESTLPVQLILCTQTKTVEGHYRWELEPQSQPILQGRPWEAQKRRLRLVDQRKQPHKGLPPCVRVEVRCKAEDLSITDIVMKDNQKWSRAMLLAGRKNREAAAISYIRSKLIEEGLEFNNIEDPFGHVTLGSVLAEHT